MEYVIKKKHLGNYYLTIYQVKFSKAYHVGLYEKDHEDYYRTVDDRMYTTIDGAKRRFRALEKRCG